MKQADHIQKDIALKVGTQNAVVIKSALSQSNRILIINKLCRSNQSLHRPLTYKATSERCQWQIYLCSSVQTDGGLVLTGDREDSWRWWLAVGRH